MIKIYPFLMSLKVIKLNYLNIRQTIELIYLQNSAEIYWPILTIKFQQ